MARKRARYSDDFRAGAVLMLEAEGYPMKSGALSMVAAHLKIPHQTLSRWGRETQNPAPPELVLEKRLNLIELIRMEIHAALGEAGKARGDASYRDLVTGAAILIDKLQLLEGKPTENVNTNYVIKYQTDGRLANAPPWTGAPDETGEDDPLRRRGLWAQVGQDGDRPHHVQ